MVQGLPDETHGVVAAGACPQLHGQAEAAHDGDGGGSPHLPGRARGRVSVAGLPFVSGTDFILPAFAGIINLSAPRGRKSGIMTSWAANDVIRRGLVPLVAIALHDHDISFSAHYAFLHTDKRSRTQVWK